MLNGKNFWMKVDDESQRLGFYTTRLVMSHTRCKSGKA